MGKLAGKVALVTGGAKGIGKAIVERFAAEGAKVAIAVRDVGAGARVAHAVGGGAAVIPLDVTSLEQWQAAIPEVERHYGRLDVLVNCAGITGGGTLEEVTEEVWRQNMSINLDGPFFGCKSALPLMLKSGDPGSIINVSSAFGLRPVPGFIGYCASKAGLTMMTQVLALELAAKDYPIRANSVHPGGTETEMLEQALVDTGKPREEALAHYLAIHPMKRMAKPAEVAAACAWLASDESGFTTGMPLTVDGGSVIRF